MAGNIKTQMTLANIIKFLEPTTLEAKMFLAAFTTGLASYPFSQNASLIYLLPLSIITQYYPIFRFLEYKHRNELEKFPNKPKKIISEYLASIDFSPERDYP